MRLVVTGLVMILMSGFAWGQEEAINGVPTAAPAAPKPREDLKSAAKADDYVLPKDLSAANRQIIQEQATATQIQNRLNELQAERDVMKDQAEWFGTKDNRDKEIKKLEEALKKSNSNVEQTQTAVDRFSKERDEKFKIEMQGPVEKRIGALSNKVDQMETQYNLKNLAQTLRGLQTQINQLKNSDGSSSDAKLTQFVNSHAFCSRAAACANGAPKVRVEVNKKTLETATPAAGAQPAQVAVPAKARR